MKYTVIAHVYHNDSTADIEIGTDSWEEVATTGQYIRGLFRDNNDYIDQLYVVLNEEDGEEIDL